MMIVACFCLLSSPGDKIYPPGGLLFYTHNEFVLDKINWICGRLLAPAWLASVGLSVGHLLSPLLSRLVCMCTF